MLMDFKIAWRNVWRNPRRTLLTLSAIAFASLVLVFMLSFQLGTYDTMINTSVKINAGHLQIQAEGYNAKRNMHQVITGPERIGGLLDAIPLIDAYTYRANAFSLISSDERTYGALVVGIDPVREARVTTLGTLVKAGSYLQPDDGGRALVGELLARNLRVSPGDEVTVLGQGRDGSVAATVLTIQGIFRSGIDELDRNTLHMLLADFQEIYAMPDAVHEVVVAGRTLRDVADIKKQIQNRFGDEDSLKKAVVLDWTELMPGLLQSIQIDLVSGVIMYIILILVVAFSILNTFLMAILERTREFGVLMAIGTRPRRLMGLVLMESACLTMVGIVAGLVLGAAVTLYFQRHGIDLGGASDILSQFGISGRMYPQLTLWSAVTGPGAVLIITLLAALYPAFRVIRLKPVQAMTAA